MEPLLHFVLPLVALLLLNIDLKTAISLALLGLLPDLDAVLLIHRSISHSIPVLALLALPLLLLARRYKPLHQKTVIIAFLVAASHSVLDLSGLTPILWPIYPYSISINGSLNGVMSKEIGLIPKLNVAQALPDFSRVTGFDYTIFTQDGLFLTLILLLPVAYNLAFTRAHSWRTRKSHQVTATPTSANTLQITLPEKTSIPPNKTKTASNLSSKTHPE
jgi:membrane-bound metal-dependent hydrolase YbcI (DUF457 family)